VLCFLCGTDWTLKYYLDEFRLQMVSVAFAKNSLRQRQSQIKANPSLFLIKHHDVKTYGGGGIAPCILLGTRLRCVVTFTFRPLYQLDKNLAGLQSRFGLGGEKDNSYPWQESNSGPPVRSLSLYWLNCSYTIICHETTSSLRDY
jgi:hypothetical protein